MDKVLRTVQLAMAVMATTLISSSIANAHPGSGIVVDRLGQVYFVDTGVGVWKIDLQGRLVRHEGPAYHWLAIDHAGRFSSSRLPSAMRSNVSVVGSNPVLLVGGDFPITIGTDGAMYYHQGTRTGPLRVMRLTVAGASTAVATLPDAYETDDDGRRVRAYWIHGIAPASDGSLYYTERHAVRRISRDGAVSLVAGNVTVPGCARPAGVTDARVVPDLRGLAVGSDGTVYVAASACSALLAISLAGQVSVVLRASDAWTPMGVAVYGRDLYVLEYRYIQATSRTDWVPRVRKLTPDGTVTVVAEVTR